jgi:large subunit ribosomal protein L2
MVVRRFKPTSPGRRHGQVLDMRELSKVKPERSLLERISRNGGRNHHGHTTTRFRGGGARRLYRVIDFKRNKDGVPGRVSTIEYDPNRTCHIALLSYADGEKRYVLAPRGAKVGDVFMSGDKVEPTVGNAMPLRNIPTGMELHNIELRPGRGGQMVRAAGGAAQLQGKDGDYGIISMPSGEMRRVHLECRATIGQVSNHEHGLIHIGKAGRKRHMGRRPHVRGSCQNPHDHPMGGGEGRRSGGRVPQSKWGQPSKGGVTRKPKARSNVFIVRYRKKRASLKGKS